MHRKKNGRLEEAMALLINNQAAFLARASDTDRQLAALDRESIDIKREMRELQRENAERSARIEAILLDHSRILQDHNGLIQALTDAVRDKIDFKTS